MTKLEQLLKISNLPGAIVEEGSDKIICLINISDSHNMNLTKFVNSNSKRKALTVFKDINYNLFIVIIKVHNKKYLIGPISISDYKMDQSKNVDYLIVNNQIKQIDSDRLYLTIKLALAFLKVYIKPKKIKRRILNPYLVKMPIKKNIFLRLNTDGIHVSYALERQVNYSVLNNNPEEIKKALSNLYKSGRIGVLSDDGPLRNFIDFGIIVISTNIRIALRHGMDFDLAYTLNDLYVHRLEKQTNTNKVFICIEESLIDLSNQLNSKITKDVPPLITRACHIMLTKANGNITIDELAKQLNISTNYFSTLFKKWIGLSATEFRTLARVNYSFILLNSTTLSLADIAVQMHFSDQAYFSNIFKKYTGITPNEYRKQPYLLEDWSIDKYVKTHRKNNGK